MSKPPMRARDLRANIKNYGFEQGVVVTMEGMLDEVAELRLHVRQCVELIDQCINRLNEFLVIGEGLRDNINQMKRDREKGDEVRDC